MSMLILPELGEGIEKATVACWHYKEGDGVQKGDDVVEVVTDKASFNIASEASGILRKILVKDGEQANIGAALGIIESS